MERSPEINGKANMENREFLYSFTDFEKTISR